MTLNRKTFLKLCGADLEILTPAFPALSGAMLTFRSPRMDDRERFKVRWRKHPMRCRPVSEQDLNAGRVSRHVFNTEAETERLVAAVNTELKSI